MAITQAIASTHLLKPGRRMIESPVAIRRVGFVYLVTVLAAVILSSSLLSSGDGVVMLFARWDVLACSVMATFPFVLLFSAYFRPTSRLRRLGIGCGCFAGAVVAIVLSRSLSVSGSVEFVSLTFIRWVVATAIALAVLIVCSIFPGATQQPDLSAKSWWAVAMVGAFAMFVPAAYVDALTDGIRIDLENSLKERRYVLAERQARTMAELKRSGSVHGRDLAGLVVELRQTVDKLEAEVRRPLAVRAPVADIGRRITLLMHLDRFEDALRLLSPLRRDARFQSICLDYQGLCWQRLQQYRNSLDAYQSAVAYWSRQPESDRKRLSLASAWKGIGFAARRLSQRTLEEQAYRTLVDLSPTAESHFLLAQCYSEHQKTQLAADHSTIAVQLDPKMKAQSESMLTSMSRDHFGCLQIP